VRLSAAFLAGLALFLGGCARDLEPAPRRPADPIGAAAYRELLRREAQLDWTPEQLVRVARAEGKFVRAQMDRLASELGGGDGLAAFGRLSQDRPREPAAALAAYRLAAERARRFVEERRLVTIPPGRPLQVIETPRVLTPGRYPFAAYLGDKLAVTLETDLSPHCRTCVAPLVAHEAFPGHHVAFLVRRQPKKDPGTEVLALANEHADNRFHGEGWGQYAEVLMLEEGFYSGDPAGELAAWRLILLRIERAALDAELHSGLIDGAGLVAGLVAVGTAREIAEADLLHHLEEPTMKASYLVGLLQILALRAELEGRRSDSEPGFDLRAFHDQLLAWPLPWPEVARRFFAVEPLVVPDDGQVLARAFRPAMIGVP
jgi:uncharacterized protein (DUF885 family)